MRKGIMTNKPIVAKMADGTMRLLYADRGVTVPALESVSHSDPGVYFIDVKGETVFGELRQAIQRALGGED
jgi:hypothetical protein